MSCTTEREASSCALGLAFNDGELLPDRYRGGAFVGQHGSWNREPRSGYKVIFVPFADDVGVTVWRVTPAAD